ncbi:MAG: SNF2-related protein [Acidobacteriota bacterium]
MSITSNLVVSEGEDVLRARLPAPEQVRRSFGEKVFQEGKALFSSGAVEELRLDDESIEGTVRTRRRQHPAWWFRDNGRLWLECTCRKYAYCEHQIALYLAACRRLNKGAVPEDTVGSEAPFLAFRKRGGWGRRVWAEPLTPASEGQLERILFPALSSPPSARYQVSLTIDVSPSALGVTFMLRSPRLALHPREISRLLQMWRSSRDRGGGETLNWSREDQRLMEFLQRCDALPSWQPKVAFGLEDFTRMLLVLRGHPRVCNPAGEQIRVRSGLLSLSMEGEFRQGRVEEEDVLSVDETKSEEAGEGRRLLITPHLVSGDRIIRPERLVFLDGTLKWWFDGRNFYLHDARFSPQQVVTAAGGERWQIAKGDRLISILRAESISLRGEAPQIREEPVEPHLSLSLSQQGQVTLFAELRSLGGHSSWPVDGRTFWQEVAEGYVTCDAQVMKETEKSLLEAGFEPDGSPGHYRMTDPKRLDSLLERRIGDWRDQGCQVELDRDIRHLVEGHHRLSTSFTIQGDGDIDWFEIGWKLEAGQETLTSEDIRALRLFPGRYYRLKSGRIVSVERGALKQQIEELQQIGYAPLEDRPQPVRLHFLARAVELAAAGAGQKHRKLSLPEPLARLYEKLRTFEGIQQVAPPLQLADVLRHYQQEGLSFLSFLTEYRFGGVLADEMGLGKTVQTLALLALQQQALGRRSSLVVCPTSVAPNWIEETAKFTPGLKAIHLKNGIEARQCNFQEYDLIVVSYGLMRRLQLEQTFRYLILDEAQNIKNPQTRNARSVKKIRAQHRLALTGTPIENSVLELWSIFDFLMPGFLGKLTHFERRYAKPIMKRQDRSRLEQLSSHVRPFILRRLKSEVAPELPPKVEQNIYCQLTRRQKKIYSQVAAAVRRKVSKQIEDQGWERSQLNILSALLRLRQLCCHPGLVGREFEKAGSGKLEAFLELLDTILSGSSRVVVFSQFVQMLKRIESRLKKRKLTYSYLDGSTRDRQKVVNTFQSKSGASVLLMSLKAGGTGINLTAADYVILYDPWWNPAVENQAIDRVHRIGQEKSVTAYRLVTHGTIEEKMQQLKEHKRDLADRVLTKEMDFFHKLTRQDLELLLAG